MRLYLSAFSRQQLMRLCPALLLASAAVLEAQPPLVSFLFQNDHDFEGALCLSKWVPIARRCFRTSIGRCLKRLLGPAEDEARGAGVGRSVRSGKRGELLPRDAVASSDVELTTGAPRTARVSVGGVYVESEKMRV